MTIGNSLTKEVKAWGTLVMFIVILSVIILKFKDISGVTANLNTTIDTFVTAFSEPKNWILIVIIAIIGIALMKKFAGKNSM